MTTIRLGAPPLHAPARARRGRGVPGFPPAPLGESLVARGLIDEATLDWALERQRETGERIGRILLASGAVHRLDLQRVLGEQWGLPFVDLLRTPVDLELAQACDPDRLVAEGWIPVRRQDDGVVVATSEPPSETLLASVRDALGDVDIELQPTPPLDVERAVLSCFRDHVIERSTVELLTNRPELSAASGYTRSQKLLFAALLVTLAVAALVDPGAGLALLLAFANTVVLGAVGFKVVTCVTGLLARVRPAAVARMDDRDLPRYRVLVPVYREANVIGQLMENLAALDYPQEKLEILVLLESDDLDTIEATRAARPPSTVRLVVVPDAQPKTKPKACNVGWCTRARRCASCGAWVRSTRWGSSC